MELKFTKMQGCGNDFIILDYDEFKKIVVSKMVKFVDDLKDIKISLFPQRLT